MIKDDKMSETKTKGPETVGCEGKASREEEPAIMTDIRGGEPVQIRTDVECSMIEREQECSEESAEC